MQKQRLNRICPFLMLANWIPAKGYGNVYCEEQECALYNEHLGCCGLIAQGVIVGIEIARKEMGHVD